MKNKLSPKQIYMATILLAIVIVAIGVFAFKKYMDENYYSIDASETSSEAVQSQPDDTTEGNEVSQTSDEEKIKQSGYSYVYSKTKNKWRKYNSNDAFLPNDILVSKGDDGKCFILYFSSYQRKYLNKNLSLENVTTFIKNGKLYTFDYSNLKMDEIVLQDGNFKGKKLSISEIQKLYPSVKIIKVSDFKNGYLTIVQNASSQTYLLLSDTDYSEYNYNIGGCGFELKRDDDLAMFTINTNGAKVVHSFFGDCEECNDEHPCLTMEFNIVTNE